MAHFIARKMAELFSQRILEDQEHQMFKRKAWEAVPPKLPFTLFKCEHRVEKANVRLGGWKHNLPH